MARLRSHPFNPKPFFTKVGIGTTELIAREDHCIFSQGTVADAVFYVQTGKVKLTVLSPKGKQAVVGVLERDSFCGEACLAGELRRSMSATAMEKCVIVRIEKQAMLDGLRQDPAFSQLFMPYVLSRNIRMQADLVDHLVNSSEKRLARILLLMARFGKKGRPLTVIAKIKQQTLADMVGTTRSRVSFFLNKWRKLGFIEYKGELHVHRSLLNVVLHD